MKINVTRRILALTAGIIINTCAIGQVAMVRTTFNTAFTPITTGAGGATLSTAINDDAVQTAVPLGFTFNYLGTNYTTIDISTNGVAAFTGFGLTAVTRNNPDAYTTTGPNGLIMPWMDDLTSDSIVYLTTGTAGNMVMTIQWNAKSYYTGATQLLRFQLKLYETTNVIEFHYGTVTAGTFSTAESATIGIENGTGGSGNYIDAVTGSSYVGNYFLEASTKWPTVFYRFTPGASTPVAAGTYTVGAAGNYATIDQAVADLNHRGISGPVVLSLTQSTYDVTPANGDNIFPVVIGPIIGTSAVNTVMIQPASGTSTFSYAGHTSGGIANAINTTAAGTTSEPILAVCGANYVTLNNINLTASGTAVDRGLYVINHSATTGTANYGGTQFCAFTNLTVTMNRANTSSIAIQQNVATAPTSAAGANSNNAYMNLSVSNSYNGIYLNGNATFPDLNCQVGNTSPTAFNTIGAATSNDIGNGTSQSYGIRCANQSGASIYNNEVRNVTSTTTTDGILIELSQGTTSVYNNRVYNIRNSSTTSTTGVTGIRANVATSAGHSLRVYNNAVYGITSGYTGLATATRQIKGMFVQSAGGGLTSSNINVDNNSVYIDASSSLNVSSTCFEIGTTTGPVMNIRNNIFYNATGAQVTPALHLAWRSTSATTTGNTGSVSNYNDLYISNATQGFVGQGNASNYATLANWQVGMVGQDINSISVDPQYQSTTNLHVAAGALDGTATTIGWVTVDFDNQARSVTPDIGADEFTAATVDVGATSLVAPVSGACYTSTETVTIRIRNYATVTHDFTVNPVVITVNVTGAVTATITYTVNTGTLASFTNLDVNVGTLNMTTAGTYTFNASTSLGADQNAANDAMTATNINFLAGTASATPTSTCLGNTTILTLSGNSSSTLQWQESTDGGITWTNIAGATTSPYTHTPLDSVLVRALVCGSITSVLDTVNVTSVAPPLTVNDTACGLATVTLTASGAAPTLSWYDAPTNGNIVNTGTSYTLALAATDTFYVQGESGASAATHTTTYAAGNGSSGNCFTIKALSNVTISSFDGHLSTVAGTPSNWEIWYRPNDYLLSPGSHLSNVGWTQVGTGTVNSAGPGNPTAIPIPVNITIPAGQTYSFQIFTTTGSVSYTNGTLLGALYNANTDLEVYQGHGGTAFSGMVNSPRVFNGRIHYSTGCTSTRTPVIGVVIPAPAVTATSSNNVCSGGTTTLVAGSANSGYDYLWSPAATLNTAIGDTVIAMPTGSMVYTVTATDSTTGCVDTAMVSVGWSQSPVVTASVSDDTICSGTTVSLDAPYTGQAAFVVGTGTITNTATSYPAPYGNFYWGSRHQMLITAADLSASGMTAGYINSLAFFIQSINATQPLDAFEIKIGTTALTSITAFQGGLTSVYYAAIYMPTNGVNTHAFSTPFYWDGVSNIIVETCHNNGSFIDNCSFYQTTTAYTSSVYFRQDAGGVCANNTVTASINQRPNMRFTQLASYEYSWSPGASLNDSLVQNPMATPMMTVDYIVTVTDSINGCVSMDTVGVHVDMSPAPAFGPDTSVCDNATLVLDGTAGNYTYLWQDNSTAQTFTVANMAGQYNVLVTDTATGCTGTDTINVAIDMAPAVFSLGPDAMICDETTTQFAGPTGPNYVYTWNTGDTTMIIAVGTTGSYDLTVTDSTNGCMRSDSVMLTVVALPIVNLGPDTAICSNGNPLILTAPAGNSYLWSTADTTQSISVSVAGYYSVLVTEPTLGCMDKDTMLLMVNTPPMFSLGADTTFCSADGPIMVMAPSGPYTYLWSDSTSGSSLSIGMSGTYYLDVNDTTTGCMSRDSIMTTVPMSPAFALSDTTNCGSSVMLTGPAGPYTYLWSTSGTGQTESVSASGAYGLTVTDTTSGCTGIDSVMVTLNANPTVTATASSMTPCADDADVMLNGSPSGGTFSGTSVVGNQFDPSVGAGAYAIIYNYTDSNGCAGADTITINVNACVGIGETNGSTNIFVFPNPSNDKVNIRFEHAINGNVTLELFDVQGKVVEAQRMENVAGGAVVVMNMSNYESGLYVLRITKDDGSTESYRLSVQH